MKFEKVTSPKVYLRMFMYGMAGAGKTLSALMIAKQIGGKVAVLDTEAGRSSHKLRSKYLEGFTWDTCILSSPSVEDYITAIETAVKEGYSTIIIDSVTPEWEAVSSSQISLSQKGVNNFQSWGKAKVPHKVFLSTILSAQINIICTCRSKTEYVVENGKPQRVGLAPQQDPNLPYFFDIVLQMSEGGTIEAVDKDESGIFRSQTMLTPTLASDLVGWLNGSNKTTTADNDGGNPLKKKYIARIVQLASERGVEVDAESLNNMTLDELAEYGKSLKQSSEEVHF